MWTSISEDRPARVPRLSWAATWPSRGSRTDAPATRCSTRWRSTFPRGPRVAVRAADVRRRPRRRIARRERLCNPFVGESLDFGAFRRATESALDHVLEHDRVVVLP